MTREITVLKSHAVMTGSVAAVNISIDGQNGVDALKFAVPEGMEGWAWRVESEQGGQKGYRLLGSDMIWRVRAGEVVEGYATLQLVGSRVDGEATKVWKSVEFHARVLPAINAAEAVTPGETSALDVIAAQVKSDADRADAAVIRAEDAAAGAENIVNTAINDIEAEGQKQAAAVASSGTQALEAIGQVEQTAIAQVQAAGTTQVGAVEDAGDSKLAEINAANAHAPQINEETGKWQVWDTQTGAYMDTGTDAQGPQGETGATGPQGPAGADGIGLPVATAEDAGKVPVVGADGSYTLSDPVPEVDATLTEAGAPADAAAVGEAIEAISPDDAAVDGKPWTSQHIVDMLCPPLEVTGNPVQCYPVSGYPLWVKASWEPRQEGEGDPSPENIRPITGLDEVTVRRSGKNVLNVTGAYRDGYNYVLPNAVLAHGVTYTYTCSTELLSSEIVGLFVIADDYKLADHLGPGESASFTVPENSDFSQGIWLAGGSRSALDGVSPESFMVEIGSTATAYEPYTGTTATLSLPSTVYGGKVDLATGEGVETWTAVEFNGSEEWRYYAIYDVFYVDGGEPFDASVAPIVNRYIGKSGVSNIADGEAAVSMGITRWFIAIRDNYYADVSEFKAALAEWSAAGSPLVVVRKRIEPLSIAATNSESIPALSDENVLITNADSLTVTGRADPVATVQALADRVAALEQAAVNLTNNTTEG